MRDIKMDLRNWTEEQILFAFDDLKNHKHLTVKESLELMRRLYMELHRRVNEDHK